MRRPAGVVAGPYAVEWQSSGRAVLAGSLVGAIAAVWLAVALHGAVTIGHLTLTPIGAAAACGTALLAATLPDLGRADGQASVLLLIGLPVVVAMAAGHSSLDPLLVAGAAVAAAGLWPGEDRWLPVARLAGCAGMVLWLVAHTLQDGGRLHADGRATAAALLGAAVLLVAAASSAGGAPSGRLLLVPALLAGVTAAPLLPVLASLAGGIGAGVAAWTRRPQAALALLAISAAAVPAGTPAARLLGAGAVVAAVLAADAAVLAGLPGAVAVAVAVARAPSTSAVVITAVAAAVVAALSAERIRGRIVLDPARVPALALAAWLLVAPGTWTWAGHTLLTTYDRGAARIVAVALVVLVVTEVWPPARLSIPPVTARGAVPPPPPPITLPPRFAMPAAAVTAVATVACAGWLVLSAIALR